METKELNQQSEREATYIYGCACGLPGSERHARTETLFWGSVLLITGGILLVNALDLVPDITARLIWPGLLLALGINMLWRTIDLD